VLPTIADGPSAWQIFSRDGKNGMRARTDVTNLIAGHPPSRLRNVEVDPFFHDHLRQQMAQQIREDTGVQLVFPDEDLNEPPEVLLVFEGLGSPVEYELPRKAPTAKELQAFESGLRAAEDNILKLISGVAPIKTEIIEVLPKFQERLRRYIDREQQRLTEGEFPLQIIISNSPRGRALQLPNGCIAIRGPPDAVDGMIVKSRGFLEQEAKDEEERSHVTTFEYPQKFANFLIGKKGENIKKLRDEFDVEIQVADGKVNLKGPPAKAANAKSHILAMAKRLEDEATYVIKIKPQYHRDLIGRSGGQVNRLQDRYNVRINFPRTAAHEDASDAGTDAGAPSRQRNQAPDEVVIKGPRRGADEAREELLNLLQYTIDNSHTATVSVAQGQIPSLIGSGGREMENLRLATGAQIDVPGLRDGTDPAGRVELKIKGGKSQVDAAKKLLQERAKEFDETVTRTIDVDRKHHKTLIGSQGSNIRDIIIAAGGSDDRRELARTVRFPRQENEGNTIRVEGKQSVVDGIIASIAKIVAERDSQTTKVVEISPDKHRLLIGRGGDTRRSLESQFHITLDVPKQTATGAARSQVKIAGQPSDVESATAHILSLVKDQEGEIVNVPRAYHYIVAGDNGAFFRRLRNEQKVTVDHAGQQPPQRPSAASGSRGRNRANGNTSLPLITDDPNASSHGNYSWELVDNNPTAGDSSSGDMAGDIPWVLRGSADNVKRARKMLEQAIEAASKPSATGYLILPDPRLHRVIVGSGGSQVSAIRKETGTSIQIPRSGGNKEGEDEAIEITGSKEGVEKAKAIILDLVNGASVSGGRKN
jgi:transcription antitermination factor NusA-like protein